MNRRVTAERKRVKPELSGERRSRRETTGFPLRRTPDPQTGSIDPIQAEVVARFLLATAEEMGASISRLKGANWCILLFAVITLWLGLRMRP